MAIETSGDLGQIIKLTGEDARRFHEQLQEPTSPAALKLFKKAQEMWDAQNGGDEEAPHPETGSSVPNPKLVP